MYGYHYSIGAGDNGNGGDDVGEFGVQNPYFSPGVRCPVGWGTSATLRSSSNAVDEQAYVCCPEYVFLC